MSADGNLKFGSLPHPSLLQHKSESSARSRERKCVFCEDPLKGHPVLLKSGQSVRLGCYFQMQKRAFGSLPN